MTDKDWGARLATALTPLPDGGGGIAVVMATAGIPPAMALLSSGDVWVAEGTVRVGLFGSSSAAARLGGAFSLMVPSGTVALRVEVVEATAEAVDHMALVSGRLADIRPTAEPPWIAEMTFRPSHPGAAAIPGHVAYWAEVRAWLRGETGPPTPPFT